MDERGLEIKVGVLLAAALAAGIVLLWLLGEFQLRGDRRLFVDFAHAGGVPAGAPAKLAGVRVGRVRAVRLLPERRDASGAPLPVQMEIELGAEALASLRADVGVAVATQGPLGEPYIEMAPGATSAAPLADGAAVRGVDPPRLDLLAARLYGFLDLAMRTLGDDPEAVRTLLRGAGAFASTAEGVLRDNREALTRATRDFSEAAGDLRQLLHRDGAVRRLAEDSAFVAATLRRDLPGIAARAGTAATGAAALAGAFTEEDGARLKGAIARYERAGQRLEEITTRAEAVLKTIEGGQGSFGGFYKDPQVYQDLKALVTDLKKHPWKVLWKE